MIREWTYDSAKVRRLAERLSGSSDEEVAEVARAALYLADAVEWLDGSYRLEDVRARLSNEGGTVLEAVDFLKGAS